MGRCSRPILYRGWAMNFGQLTGDRRDKLLSDGPLWCRDGCDSRL